MFHNQITKYQGVFGPRVTYHTFGLHTIANNLGVPSVALEFPTLDRFIREIKNGYDYIGIGSIGLNFQTVRRMRDSKNPILRERAEMLAQSFFRYRAVLKGSAWLAPTLTLQEQILQVLAGVEEVSSRTGLVERAAGLGLYGFGSLRRIRTRFFGDTIQPRTTLTRYSGSGGLS